jgi:hypothetical protein
VSALLAAAAALALGAGAASDQAGTSAFLQRWGLSAGEQREVESGGLVARMLEVSDRKDIATLVALRIAAPRAFVVRWLKEQRDRRSSVVAAGEIADPPDPRDVAGLNVARPQAEELDDCRPGHCEMNLTREAIDAVTAARATSGHVSPDAASAALRRVLLDTAAAYRRDGDAGLPVYADRPAPLAGSALLGLMLSTGPDPLAALPEVRQRLGQTSPRSGRLTWVQEKTWKRIVVTLDHEMLEDVGPDETVHVSKRLYANHYYEAGLIATALHESKGMCYVVALNRTRTDVPSPGFSGLQRALVNLLVRRRARGQWEEARVRLEEGWRAQAQSAYSSSSSSTRSSSSSAPALICSSMSSSSPSSSSSNSGCRISVETP